MRPLLLLATGWTVLAAVACGPREPEADEVAGKGAGAGIFAPAVPPERVLPTNAGAVDLLSVLASPDRFCALPGAADDFSRVSEEPERWATIPRFTGLSAEVLLSHRPDLVVAHVWQSPETLDLVRRAGVTVLVLPLPRSWEDIRAALLTCGRALDAEPRARALLAELDGRVAALAARAAAARAREPRVPRALSYVNLGTGGWVAGAGTTADVLFGLAGVVNAAADDGLVEHTTVDVERLLALAPDVLVIGAEPGADKVPPTEAWLRGRPELARLPALRDGALVRLPARLFATSSQELVAGAELLRDRLDALAQR